MADKRYNILLAGESWVTTATHIKGFDQFPTVTFHLGAEPLVEALKSSAFDLRYMPSHEATDQDVVLVRAAVGGAIDQATAPRVEGGWFWFTHRRAVI